MFIPPILLSRHDSLDLYLVNEQASHHWNSTVNRINRVQCFVHTQLTILITPTHFKNSNKSVFRAFFSKSTLGKNKSIDKVWCKHNYVKILSEIIRRNCWNQSEDGTSDKNSSIFHNDFTVWGAVKLLNKHLDASITKLYF